MTIYLGHFILKRLLVLKKKEKFEYQLARIKGFYRSSFGRSFIMLISTINLSMGCFSIKSWAQ